MSSTRITTTLGFSEVAALPVGESQEPQTNVNAKRIKNRFIE
jgi:hypothetical protein